MPVPDLTIPSFRGGLNTDDPASELKPDEMTEALNVELHTVPCGERRRGCEAVTGDGGAAIDSVALVARYLPSDDQTLSTLWVLKVITANDFATFAYKDTSWHTVTPDNPTTDSPYAVWAYHTDNISFHHKLFLPYRSGTVSVTTDRLHVYDGTTLRRVGIAPPTAAPTGANTGVGTFSGTRYYRVRWIVEDADGNILRRSEPSDVLTKAPSGTGTGIVVTKPTTGVESPTHWELEASVDNSFFYRIATTVIATTTVTDSAAFSTGYALTGVLSEESGAYTVPESVKFVLVDEDRLVLLNSWENTEHGSRVQWTPVWGDPGVGNDERIPIATTNFLDLDWGEDGEITAGSQPSNGFFYVFKWHHIYKLVRTGIRDQAYTASVVSKTLGALEGSVVSGVDELGRSCVYALDPSLGLYRIGANGLQRHFGLGTKVNQNSFWSRVNTDATHKICCSVYYSDTQQVKWFIAVDGSNVPNMEIKLQTEYTRSVERGFEGGLTLSDGEIANAVAACMYAENINDNVARTLVLKPVVGTFSDDLTGKTRMQDIGDDDDGTAFYATLTSAPFMSTGLLNRFGTLVAGFIAIAAAGVSVIFGQSRNFGAEEKTSLPIDLSPAVAESEVFRNVDDSGFADCRALQVSLHDDTPATGRWAIAQIALAQSVQERASG
jgi:hypothetical protein